MATDEERAAAVRDQATSAVAYGHGILVDRISKVMDSLPTPANPAGAIIFTPAGRGL